MFGITRVLSVIIVSVTATFNIFRQMMQQRKSICKNFTDLTGKLAIVTGSNTGMGKETARELAKKGARVILACRDVEKAETAAEDIRSDVTDATVIVKKVDLSLMESVKSFAEEIKREEEKVDILINNAATLLLPKSTTSEGHEYSFATNYLGHFLLTNLLLDKISKSDMKRVVIVSSNAHKIGKLVFDSNKEVVQTEGWKQYGNTKLMNCLFAQELTRRVAAQGICVFTVAPPAVDTELLRNHVYNRFTRLFQGAVGFVYRHLAVPPTLGCQTTIYCATEPGIEHLSGSYFSGCRVSSWSGRAGDADSARMLWAYSESKVNQYI